MTRHIAFDGIRGYATHARAVKRGEEIAAQLPEGDSSSWVVISLPNGRFAPSFIYREGVSLFQPFALASQTNVCVMN